MSDEKRIAQSTRWLDTARQDFEDAKILYQNGRHASTCFHAQQAAEKAVKSYMIYKGWDPWGHSIVKMLGEIRNYDPQNTLLDLLKDARNLDRLYIPTRYPDGLPDITPAEAFGPDDSTTGLASAKLFISTVENLLQ